MLGYSPENHHSEEMVLELGRNDAKGVQYNSNWGGLYTHVFFSEVSIGYLESDLCYFLSPICSLKSFLPKRE